MTPGVLAALGAGGRKRLVLTGKEVLTEEAASKLVLEGWARCAGRGGSTGTSRGGNSINKDPGWKVPENKSHQLAGANSQEETVTKNKRERKSEMS